MELFFLVFLTKWNFCLVYIFLSHELIKRVGHEEGNPWTAMNWQQLAPLFFPIAPRSIFVNPKLFPTWGVFDLVWIELSKFVELTNYSNLVSIGLNFTFFFPKLEPNQSNVGRVDSDWIHGSYTKISIF